MRKYIYEKSEKHGKDAAKVRAYAHTEHVREIVLRSKNTVIFMMSYDWVYYEKTVRTEEIE